MRTLLRPLINPSMDVIRASDLQPHTPGGILGPRIRREGVMLLRGADGVADDPELVRYVCGGEELGADFGGGRGGACGCFGSYPEHVDVAVFVGVGDGLVEFGEEVGRGGLGEGGGDPGAVAAAVA